MSPRVNTRAARMGGLRFGRPVLGRARLLAAGLNLMDEGSPNSESE
jgi:hypothetical protein